VNDLLQRLKQRKLVQWAIAYIAGSFALIQVLDVVSDSYAWPRSVMHIVFGLLALGFVVVLVLAWYHGERGAQRISGPELLLIALVLAVGGGLLWHFARDGSSATVTKNAVASVRSPDAPQRNPGVAIPDSAAAAAASGLRAASAQTAPIPAKSIAVLPFQNLSNDKNNDYFVAGMQDLILTKLADIGDLKVISRTSTLQYGSHPENLKTVGGQLGVATILEGSVQKQGNQVLVNVQLINARTDSHIWAESYTRTLDNVFGVEGEVAGKIATALNAKLSPAQSTQLAEAPTTNKAAYDLFLHAEYQVNKGVINYDTASYKAAIPLYQQAIQHDASFALAYARLSYAESELAWFGGGGGNVKQLVQQARADAEHALQLQPGLAAAQLAIGYSDYYGRGDYAAALQAFSTALKLKPNDADTLAAQGYVERRQGRVDEAIASFKQAQALDPRNSALAYELGTTYQMASRYAEAESAFQRALALDPDNRNARTNYSSSILLSAGDIPRALAAAQGDDPALQAQRVSLLTYQRKFKEALALLDSIPDTPDNFPPALNGLKTEQQAILYRMMGDDVHARPLFAQSLPVQRAQLKMLTGISRAFQWENIAYAEIGLGQTAAGLDSIAKSTKIRDNANDHLYGPQIMLFNAQLYAQAHRPDLAVPLLAKALAASGIGVYYSPVMLWLDPYWDPIRHDSGFQALLKKYAKYKPAVIYDTK
jgi:TolB-like protein